jgi:hypothetical protein
MTFVTIQYKLWGSAAPVFHQSGESGQKAPGLNCNQWPDQPYNGHNVPSLSHGTPHCNAIFSPGDRAPLLAVCLVLLSGWRRRPHALRSSGVLSEKDTAGHPTEKSEGLPSFELLCVCGLSYSSVNTLSADFKFRAAVQILRHTRHAVYTQVPTRRLRAHPHIKMWGAR